MNRSHLSFNDYLVFSQCTDASKMVIRYEPAVNDFLPKFILLRFLFGCLLCL